MRVLHVTPDYHPAMGGGESYARQVSERLAARGHEVTVLAMNSRGLRRADGRSLSPRETLNRVQVVRLNRTYALHERLLRIRGAYRALDLLLDRERARMLTSSPLSMRAFVMTLLTRADVIGVFNWYHGSLAYQACVARRLRRVRLVGIPLTHTERPWAQSPLLSHMLSQCDAVVAMTEHEKRFIEARTFQPNAHVVGAGIEPADFAERDGQRFRAEHGIRRDALVVGYVGRMSATKGVVTLIRAMQAVWVRDPTVRLLLAGSGLPSTGRSDPDVRAAWAGLSQVEQSRIVAVPSFKEEDKASIFDALDVFAMVSTAESFGIAYLEAWMCGKAVIGSAISSTECVIQDRVDGRLVPADDSPALAVCISELLSNRSARESMGRAGHAKTTASFTWERVTDAIERIYTSTRTAAQPGRQPAGAMV